MTDWVGVDVVDFTSPCERCGTRLTTVDGRSRRKRFCGPTCRDAARNTSVKLERRQQLIQKPCAHCGELLPFMARKWCSKGCRDRGRLGAETESLQCGGCGRRWTRTRAKGKPSRCPKCVDEGSGRRRIPKSVAQMVFDRDGWECQLCFRNIDPAAVMPDWGSATVDHVIPVAFGGRDDPGNLRAAHFHCNAQRQTGEFDISRAASPDRLVAGAQRIDKLRERDSRIIDDVLRGDLTVREIAARYGFADYGSVAMVLRRRGVAVNAQARRWRVERSRAAL